jgi:hypothetical protein
LRPSEQDLVISSDPDIQAQLTLQVGERIEKFTGIGHEERVAKSGARSKDAAGIGGGEGEG